LTGIFEFAAKFFRVGFKDLINPDFGNGYPMNPRIRAAAFWNTLAHFAQAVEHEAERYSRELGMNTPHTNRTIKPSGTISKLWGLSEGAHLPSHRRYLRWVQFRHDDPLVDEYRKRGYPTRELVTYQGTIIVGFPTEPVLTELLPDDQIVTAGEATPEEQIKWLQLLERFWLSGNMLQDGPDRGNQISFTLGYDPAKVGIEDLRRMLLEFQPTVKACSIMPVSEDGSGYEYLPMEAIPKAQYEDIARKISEKLAEDVELQHVDSCVGGVCPINFNSGEK